MGYSAATSYKSLVDTGLHQYLSSNQYQHQTLPLNQGPAVADGHSDHPFLKREVPQRQVPDHELLQLTVGPEDHTQGGDFLGHALTASELAWMTACMSHLLRLIAE